MKVLVCGGRDFEDVPLVFRTLDAIHAETPIDAIIEGGARGADRAAYLWSRGNCLSESYPADWANLGRSAGPIRNEQMLREGNPDLVVAFPGGRGTEHMISIAERAGVPVRRVAG
jgi:hypothetical protein